MEIIKNYADEDRIRISWYIKKTDLLGPFLRSVLWVQGCSRNCPGCIAEHTHSPEGGKAVRISKIAERFITETSTEGMTITGGEPFLQADKLCRLIELHLCHHAAHAVQAGALVAQHGVFALL